jgi:hypothetical protein
LVLFYTPPVEISLEKKRGLTPPVGISRRESVKEKGL